MNYQGQLQLGTKGTNWIDKVHGHGVNQSDGNGQLRQATDKILYWLGTSAVNLLAHSFLDMDVALATLNLAPLPPGPKIFAANHPTTLDPFLLLTLVPEEMSILVTGGAFTVPLFGRYLRRVGHIPVIRGRERDSFAEAERLLDEGRSVGIFPEGALSPAIGAFHRPRTGVARLALQSGAPVIPVGFHPPENHVWHIPAKIDGERVVGRFFASGAYGVTVGSPLHFSGDIEDWDHVRAVSLQLMQRIMQLSRRSAARIGQNQQPTIEVGPVSNPLQSSMGTIDWI